MTTEKQKKIFAKNFNHYLSIKNVNRADISRKLGYPETTLANWANGISYPRIDKIQELADFFEVNKSDLIEDKSLINQMILRHPDLHPIKRIRNVPILGSIACGTPITAVENLEGYIGIDPEHMDGDLALYCKGDSMIEAGINNGDLVLIHQTPDVENGTIAAVVIEDEATLKKVYKQEKTVVLQPCNNNYAPIVIDLADEDQVYIIGECVGVYHSLNQ
ncbi:LexA family transcriptional regulator [Peptoniphilaceae bacterium SGI.097]